MRFSAIVELEVGPRPSKGVMPRLLPAAIGWAGHLAGGGSRTGPSVHAHGHVRAWSGPYFSTELTEVAAISTPPGHSPRAARIALTPAGVPVGR